MPIFSNNDKPTQQPQWQKQKRKQASEMSPEEQLRNPEAGAEEGSPLDLIPESHGGTVDISGIAGIGKHLGKDIGLMGKFLRGSEAASEEAPAARGVVSKLSEKGPPSKSLNYGEMGIEKQAARDAAEEAAPVINYQDPKVKKTKEELDREARRNRIKPTKLEYDENGNPTEVGKD